MVSCYTALSKAVPLHAMDALGGERRDSSYSFTPSVLNGGKWSASRLGRALPPGKGPPGTHCTGGWVGPRAGLDTEARRKTLCLYWGSQPGRPVRRLTLYCLSYPGSHCTQLGLHVSHPSLYVMLPYVAVKWLALLLHMQEVPGSGLSPQIVYLDRDFA
jgi:hypothetical protein